MKGIELAWRNTWRNKRRTLITAASVFFAVFFAILMRSFQLGSYDLIFRNVIESYSGYLQLQNSNFFDEPSLDNGFELNRQVIDTVLADRDVEAIVPRIESYALAAGGAHTQGVIVMGIDPEGEALASGTKNRLVKIKLSDKAIATLKTEDLPERTKKLLDLFPGECYSGMGMLMSDLGIKNEDTATVFPVIRKHAGVKNSYLVSDDENAVLIGSGLSDYLKLGTGDTLVLMGQGYHGATAAGKYIIKGIVKLPAPDIDNIIVYMPVNTARGFYSAPDLATSAVLRLRSNADSEVNATAARLEKTVPEDLAIKTWHELNALVINQMEADSRSGMIMIGILYLVIAFGVFGTVLMMLAERRREFGMLVSIGMQKRKLAGTIALEMVITGFIGVAGGVLASLPLVFYGHYHPYRLTGEMARMYEDYGYQPIMPTLLPDTYYLWQCVVVLIIVAIAIGFSTRRIFRIDTVNYLKG